MRIAVDLSPALTPMSGSRFYVESLLEGLAAVGQGHEFLLYAAFWKEPERLAARNFPKASNFNVVHKRVPSRWLIRADECGFGFQERWLKGLGVDVFHGTAAIAPPLKSVRSVLTLHHIERTLGEGFDAWDRYYFDTLTGRSLQRADRVISVSEFSRGEALREYRLDPARIVTVHEGGPAPDMMPAPAGAPRARPWPYVLHVGNFVGHKRVPDLVRAFHRMLSRAPDRPERLVLAGRPHNELEVVRLLVQGLKLEDRVEFVLGASRPELVALYQHAAVVVVPSQKEGFGFTPLEAMACGTPVVSSDGGALPEIGGDAVRIVPVGDIEKLSRELELVLSQPEFAAEMAKKGLARVKTFSWETAARATLSVYQSALKK